MTLRPRAATFALVLVAAHFEIGAAQKPPTPTSLAETARAALDAGDLPAAENAYRQLLLTDRGALTSRLGWATALVRQGRGGEAVRSLVEWAEGEIDHGSFASAIALLDLAAEAAPADLGVRSRLGQAMALDRRYGRGAEILESAWRDGRRDLQTLLYLASCRWENGDLDSAEERYREAIDRHGRAPLALHQLGRLLIWRSRFAEAVVILDEAERRGLGGFDLAFDQARGRAGAAAAGELPVESAVLAYRRLVALAPEHSQARYGLARALARAGATEDAAREMATYETLYEADIERTRDLGLQQARLVTAEQRLAAGDSEGALGLVAGLDGSAEVHRIRALCRLARGEAPLAAGELRQAIALEPDRQDLRNLLAEIEGRPPR